jgi:hypothetical protein
MRRGKSKGCDERALSRALSRAHPLTRALISSNLTRAYQVQQQLTSEVGYAHLWRRLLLYLLYLLLSLLVTPAVSSRA